MNFSPETIQESSQSLARVSEASADYMFSISQYVRALNGDWCRASHVRASCGGTLEECQHVLGSYIMIEVVAIEGSGQEAKYYFRETAPTHIVESTEKYRLAQLALPLEEQDYPPVFITPTNDSH